eukprot:scaffold1640_cov161-Amphora_coffeaeformis.AAC.26
MSKSKGQRFGKMCVINGKGVKSNGKSWNEKHEWNVNKLQSSALDHMRKVIKTARFQNFRGKDGRARKARTATC